MNWKEFLKPGILILIVAIFLVWLLVLPISSETLLASGIYIRTVNICDADEDCAVMECTEFQVSLPKPHFFRTGCINKNTFIEILERGVPTEIGNIPENCAIAGAWVITNTSCFCRIPLTGTGEPMGNTTLCLGKATEQPKCSLDNMDFCRVETRRILGIIR